MSGFRQFLSAVCLHNDCTGKLDAGHTGNICRIATLKLPDEVVPMAGYGIVIGGSLHGTAFISKGGMVGDEKAMITCVSYLQQYIN